MAPFLVWMCLLGRLLRASSQPTVSASEFHLEGDYLIGGLFNIHRVSEPVYYDKPEVIDCSSEPLILSSYRRFQMMRFAVEEINNSTNLLPNVSLGFDIHGHCSNTLPGIFSLLSVNRSIHPWSAPQTNLSKMIAVVGAYTSTETLTVAPLFMIDLIPMVNLPYFV
ncbi:taste receptor type 1 member 1-like [Solea senegalensis]|uniref:Taste receptor type 1 member 1-like n=1 Tax=Solea senegalensis TaxID=28829 RepID=A0AAV6STG6_SOLSE|nr:taste receptor type 1 member 1-like [Solea senegalensis]